MHTKCYRNEGGQITQLDEAKNEKCVLRCVTFSPGHRSCFKLFQTIDNNFHHWTVQSVVSVIHEKYTYMWVTFLFWSLSRSISVSSRAICLSLLSSLSILAALIAFISPTSALSATAQFIQIIKSTPKNPTKISPTLTSRIDGFNCLLVACSTVYYSPTTSSSSIIHTQIKVYWITDFGVERKLTLFLMPFFYSILNGILLQCYYSHILLNEIFFGSCSDLRRDLFSQRQR